MEDNALPIIAIDCETWPIGKDNPKADEHHPVHPPPVVYSFASRQPLNGLVESTWEDEGHPFHGVFACLINDTEPTFLESVLKYCFEQAVTIFHGPKFDLPVTMRAFPRLVPAIWKAMDEGRVHDTLMREKIVTLSTTGDIQTPDFDLASLEAHYFGFDRSIEKKDPDSWRMRYHELSGVPVGEWPQEAIDYCLDDAASPLVIWERQEQRKKPEGPGSIRTARFNTMAEVSLALFTAEGFATDPVRVAGLRAAVEDQLSDERMAILYESGILRKPIPPRPHKRNPKKMTKGKPASIDTKKLTTHVRDIWLRKGVDDKSIPRTKTGAIQVDKDVLATLDGEDPVLDAYGERQKYIKLQSTFLPVLEAGRVYPNYNGLVRTTRTSSSGFQRGRELYPSTNIQNQPRLVGEFSVRECYVPDEGWIIWAVDFSSQELVSAADKCVSLFGRSELANLINDGVDAHAYLGAQLCAVHHEGFRKILTDNGITDKRAIYELFAKLKTHSQERLRKLFKLYRTFAKPVGLGYWGGMMYETFVKTARKDYGLRFTLDEAFLFRKTWMETFPETHAYFDFVNRCGDPHNLEKYAYVTPLGLYRAGASYCAAANGIALQSPTAEGAKDAVIGVTRAMFDPDQNSILFGSRPKAFVHDEIVGQSPYATEEDILLAPDRVKEVCRLMVEPMQRLMSHVKVSVEATMMHRWSKNAEPVFDEKGNLIPFAAEV